MRPEYGRGGLRARGGVLSAVVLLTFSAVGVLAQEEEDVRRRGIFIDSIDVSLINLEVRVTSEGEPVTDLVEEDFEILDDGEPVRITNFYSVQGGGRSAPSTSAQGDEPPDLVAEPLPARERLSVIVLVDHPFLSPPSRKTVFDRLSEHLDGLMPSGGQVMVVSKSREVVIEQPLTSDRAAIESAFERLTTVATHDYGTEVRRVVESMDQGAQAIESRQTGPSQSFSQTATSLPDARAALNRARSISQQLHQEVRYSLALMQGFVGSLAGLPGRKALVYVADRLPVRAGELVWRAWFQKYGLEHGSRLGVGSVDAALADYDSSREYRELIADASANRISFYPIGVGMGTSLAGAESRGLSMQGRVPANLTVSDDARHWLAVGTGGQAAPGRGSFAGFFEHLQKDLSNYYSLAYPSPHRGDGETHRVEVRVRRPGVEVRYLTEYRDKSADHQLRESTLASLLLGVSDNPLDVRVEVGKAQKDRQNLYRVPVRIGIPVANLVLLPEKTAHWGKLSIQLIVRDEKGGLSDPVVVRMPIEIPHRTMLQALSERAIYPTELLMRSGRQTIAVGVHDDLGAAASNVFVTVDVGGRE